MGQPGGTLESLALTAVRVDPAFWAGRRVFVTGHTGFKGSWLVLLLRHLGAEVSGFSLPPPTQPSLYTTLDLDADCGSTIGDIRDARALHDALSGANADVVLHLAAQPLVRASYDDPVGTYATNVMGTVHLLDAVRRVGGIDACVVVTTDKCYDNAGIARGYVESDPMGGHDPYSNSKGCCELVVAAYRDSFLRAAGIPTASARAGNVIGGGDYAADRLVPDAIRAFAAGTALSIRHPDAVRPWQHVLEPLVGYLILAQRLAAGEPVAEGWNFGPPVADAAPVRRIADRIAARWGDGAGWTCPPGEHPHEAALLMLDCAKAHDRLGWTPRLSLDQAVDWTSGWYRGVHDGADPRAMCQRQINQYLSL